MGSGAGFGTAPGAPADEDREEWIRALRRRVYGPDARPEDVAALAAALDEIPPTASDAAAVADRRISTVASAVADLPISTVEAADQRTASSHPDGPPVPPVLVRFVRAVPPRLALATAAVAVVGALAGAAGMTLLGGGGPAFALPAAPTFTPAVSVRADPAVLNRRPPSVDRPAALVGPDLLGASFRRLGAYPEAGVTFWAARDRFGETCLVAADTYYRTACADPATFAKDGVELSWSAGPGWPVSTTENYSAVWRGGRLTAGRTAS